MNLVIMHGRLSKDVEVKKSQSGTAVANFSIAVKRDFANQSETDVDFFSCVAFGKTAENISKFFVKGDGIIINGKLQNDSYEKDGQKRTITKIIVNGFDFAEKAKQGNANSNKQAGIDEMIDDDELPF